MNSGLLRILRCPSCGGALELTAQTAQGEETIDGTLRCGCAVYPVVGGVPVLSRGGAAELALGLLAQNRAQDALLALIEPPPPALAHRWLRGLARFPGGATVSRLGHAWERRGLERALRGDPTTTHTAREMLWLYFRQTRENYYYMSLRFGQPRHLVALSLASSLTATGGTILDLACGCGHVTFGLAASGRPVVGVDTFFFGLYLAKNWICPEGQFVCCAADAALPFADGAFGGAIATDAFHYFEDKPTAVAQLRRVTRDEGMFLFSGLHNARMVRQLAYGLPLAPAGYAELFPDIATRLVDDATILDRYLERMGPPLAASSPAARLESAPLLSLAASRRPDLLVDGGRFAEWPHGVGRWRLNPLFEAVGGGAPERGDTVRLRLHLPSRAYAQDQAEALRYLPAQIDVDAGLLARIAAGDRPAEADPLLRQCVVVGTPERYG